MKKPKSICENLFFLKKKKLSDEILKKQIKKD
jgi:hypothetical protein